MIRQGLKLAMKLYPLLMSTALLLSSTGAFAACDGFVCSGKISSFAESLRITENGIELALNRTVDRKALMCDLIADRYISISGKKNFEDSIHAVLLTAFSANADVIIELNPVQRQCQLHAIEIIPASY